MERKVRKERYPQAVEEFETKATRVPKLAGDKGFVGAIKLQAAYIIISLSSVAKLLNSVLPR